jgi:GTPase
MPLKRREKYRKRHVPDDTSVHAPPTVRNSHGHGRRILNDQHVEPGVPSHRCGFVAIVGLPNSGKSTLMNRYLREKVSIVSDKPQTTRTNVTTILSADTHQVIFIDTPGILKPRYRMQEVMASFIDSAVSGADMALFISDAAAFTGEYPDSVVRLAEQLGKMHVVVALNKIDIVKKPALLPLIDRTARLFPNSEILPISALDGEGTDNLFAELLTHLPVGPKLYPDDIISNEPERFFVSELIREAIFVTMEQEIPYASAVIIESFEEKKNITVISARILVEKQSQKPIIIGKRGSTIKTIGTSARHAVEAFLGGKVFLELHVSVRKDWRKKDAFLREAGLLRRNDR